MASKLYNIVVRVDIDTVAGQFLKDSEPYTPEEEADLIDTALNDVFGDALVIDGVEFLDISPEDQDEIDDRQIEQVIGEPATEEGDDDWEEE